MKTKISYLLLLALIISASRGVANGQDILSGRIYEGEVGDQSTPLAGVTVSLYGSTDLEDYEKGELIVSTATDSTGGYGLEVPDNPVYEFYNIIVPEPLSGYVFVNATTVSGTVKESNWIQYTYPLDGKTLTDNKFWQLHELINNPPVVNAGHDQVFGTPVPIPIPYPVPLVSTVTDDGLPDPSGQMTFEWSVVSGPGDVGLDDGRMDLKDPDSSYPVVATFYQYGTYVLRLTASDGELEAYDDVQVSLIGENGLVAYYPVYEGEGELLHDVSGNVHHGVKIGDPCGYFATPINIPGMALEFDGDDYVSIEDVTVETVATGQITVSTWVSFEGVPEGASVTIPLIEKGEVYKLTAGLHDSDEPLRFGFAVLGEEASCEHQPGFEERRWYHVVGTYDGQQICSYIDGTLRASKDHVTVLTHTNPTTIGGPVPAEDTPLFGSTPYRIDEVRMYSRAQTPAEVYEQYYTASQVLRYEQSLIPGDAGRDGRVDLRDLAIMADNWLVSENP
jgi:hypothetical protein